MDSILDVYTLVSLIVLVIIVLLLIFWFGPIYNVWSERKKGQADLARAQSETQIQVAQAQGRLAAAEANKKAAIVEAEAVAEQIKTIGTSLSSHDLYLRWQWIRMMEEREGETIYVPTEANLPILEANRRAA